MHERLETDDGEKFLAHDARGFPYQVRLYRDVSSERVARIKRAFVPFEHLNVAAFTDSGEGPDHGWLARPHLEGPTLDRLLAAGPLAPDEVERMVMDLLDGLEALHSAGILFDYWRLENILWHDERWVLCDVGLRTRVERDAGLYYPRLRPLAYHAPEKLVGNQVTGKSDFYSLGAMACHALLGEGLFLDSEETLKFVMRVLTEEPLLRERSPQAPARLLDALELFLQKQPEDRDAVEARALLEQRGMPSQPKPEVEGFLSGLREGGTGLEGGEFTLDPRKALEKLRDFQFPQSHHYLLPLVAGLVSRGATAIRIKSTRESLVLTSDAAPLSEEELAGLFLAATRRGESLAHLGMGLLGALGAGGRTLALSTSGYKARISRVSERVEVKKRRGGSGISLEIQGPGLTPQPPPDLLLRFLFCSADVTWNGQSLTGGEPMSVWGRQILDGDEFVLRGAVVSERPGLFIQVDGLSYQLASGFILPQAAVVLDGPWRLSLSYQAIRGDKRRQTLREAAADLLLEKAAEQALYQPLDLSRAEFYERFLHHISPDALKAALVK